MVKFSQAASVLLLALGTTAFVPSKLGNVAVRSGANSGAVQQIESCDAKVCTHRFVFNFSTVVYACTCDPLCTRSEVPLYCEEKEHMFL